MGLLVVGMHRSGTSAVGRLLDALGLPTAPADRLMAADDDNRLGYWEVRPLTGIDVDVLAAVGAHWAAPPDADADRLRDLARGPLGERASTTIAELLPGRRWFFKDPRLSVLLPFWTELLPDDVAVLHVIRHPAEVAGSLAARDAMAPPVAAALWERYTRQGVIDGAGHPSHVVDYGRLVESPEETTAALARFLEANELIDGMPTGGSAAVDGRERHHDVGDDGGAALSAEQRDLYALMVEAADGPAPVPADLPDETPALDLAFAVGGDVAAIARVQGERLAEELDRTRAAHQAALGAVRADLAAARTTAQAEIDRLHALREEAGIAHERAVEGLRADLQGVRAELGALYRRSAEGADLETVRRDLELALAEARAEAQRVGPLEAELAGIRQQFAAEIGSNTYQAIAVYRRIAGQLLPGETRRGRAYRGAMRVARRGASGTISRVQQIRAAQRARRGPDPAAWPPGVEMAPSVSPLVSIVIPVYGEWEVTRHCLMSVAEHTASVPYEVIVVDDASPDETPAFLEHSTGMEVVTNRPNLGFLRATNAGAERATGEFVVLLNNDTEVTPGWIEALLSTFERSEDVGMVGAKLVYPTGELQEAGSIIWSDGSGWNYGRGGDPQRFSYQFVREVDYCSAACVAIRRSLWKRLGGFDERFVPAYYEDTDLAFRARRAGYRVLYQPECRVIHHEGVSHGTDESTGAKANQVRNRTQFVDAWAGELNRQHLPDPGAVRRASDRSQGPSLLVVDHQIPSPDRDSGSLRMTHLLELLVDLGYRVRFAAANRYQNPPYEKPLQQLGIEVVYGDYDPAGYLDEIAGDVDVAILSRPLVAVGWMPILRELLPHCRIIYDMVDNHALRETRRAETTASSAAARQADLYGELERVLVGQADLTFAISDPERDELTRLVPDAAVVTIPNVHDRPPSAAPFEHRAGLLFVGSWAHPPNRDAIEWLVSELAPDLRSRLPGVLIHVVGSDIPPEVASRAPDVVVHGWVEDIDPIFDEVRLSIAPLRYGAGMKGKVGDSIARGVPIVTTSVGAEGFGFSASFQPDVADTADEFVGRVVELYTDRDRWIAQREAGHRAIVEGLGRSAVREKLERHLDQLVAPTAP